MCVRGANLCTKLTGCLLKNTRMYVSTKRADLMKRIEQSANICKFPLCCCNKFAQRSYWKQHKFTVLLFWRSEVQNGSCGQKTMTSRTVILLEAPGRWSPCPSRSGGAHCLVCSPFLHLHCIQLHPVLQGPQLLLLMLALLPALGRTLVVMLVLPG